MPTVKVNLFPGPDSSYPIVIERGMLARLPALIGRVAKGRRVAIVTDSKVAKHYGRALQKKLGEGFGNVRLVSFPSGERSKTRETKARVEDELLAAGYGRDTLIVALGGGVVGDLAGYVASTLHRGVPFVQVPTTLLAMVDSSVGGKTGVDTPHGKNLIGAFWQPILVAVDPDVLRTLPRREVLAGAAEVAKHGVVASAPLFKYCEKNLEGLLAAESAPIARAVRESCRIKAVVVSRDEREGGYRQILNFGHTIAHAIELVRGFSLLHGEAVWAGMAVEALLAEELGLLPAKDAGRIAALCERAFPVRKAMKGIDPEAVVRATASDKKARQGKVRYALPEAIGRMHPGPSQQWSVVVSDEVVHAALKRSLRGA